MSLLASVLLPTRFRPQQLLQTIRSINDTAGGDDLEILVRIHDDDQETIDIYRQLNDMPGVLAVVMPAIPEYGKLDTIFNQLLSFAQGTWCFQANDDMCMEGENWLDKLRAIPTTGFVVQPEIYQLNESIYHHVQGGTFPFFPTNSIPKDGFPAPVDTALDLYLRNECGWSTAWLPGIKCIHDRKVDKTLEKERF